MKSELDVYKQETNGTHASDVSRAKNLTPEAMSPLRLVPTTKLTTPSMLLQLSSTIILPSMLLWPATTSLAWAFNLPASNIKSALLDHRLRATAAEPRGRWPRAHATPRSSPLCARNAATAPAHSRRIMQGLPPEAPHEALVAQARSRQLRGEEVLHGLRGLPEGL
eukprot:CAMPEP_0203846372 /NCGR_PEP_ID=MMETSP0359-20131031/4389_1 /ASSEMBLY_ACC=CAM_ASM_000338 /TAXON_ID=268821 /ORGANISM="Scrippsiella Hangoei, Strain SHTV-5" /LENGTH=165 /DNA_ID=CAMNT_0050761687 /DNA_START=305 /DNA_END=801 /DNA_ORIENTATION=-